MDEEEKKHGGKKRGKRVEVSFESDDNEPIGALFKLSKKRKPKKTKAGSDVAGEKEMSVEVREGAVVVVEDDFGNMDDTLASFRKKLKGPKREGGGKVLKVRSDSVDLAEPLERPAGEPLKDDVVESMIVDKGQDAVDEELNKLVMPKKRKNKTNKKKIESTTVLVGNDSELRDASVCPEFQVSSKKVVHQTWKTEEEACLMYSCGPNGGTEENTDKCDIEAGDVTRDPVNDFSSALNHDPSLVDGLKQCSMIKENLLEEVSLELPNSVSVTTVKEEMHGLSYVDLRKVPTDTSFEEKDDISLSNAGKEIVESCSHHKQVDGLSTDEQKESCKQLNGNNLEAPGDHLLKIVKVPELAHDCANKKFAEVSTASMHPDGIENSPEPASFPDSNDKDGKLSAAQRQRKTRKHRHGDMAYEGDAEWDALIDEHGFLESHPGFDSDRPHRSRGRYDSSANRGTAAVSVGLKARAACPVEKIKFKDILKRKGGLQEYLECRNWILNLWSKDVTHLLSLADCGVTNDSLEDESPRVSLIREIYAFLDQNGYINTGVASIKHEEDAIAYQHNNLVEEKEVKNTGGKLASFMEAPSSCPRQFKSPGISLEANDSSAEDNSSKDMECNGSGSLRPLVESHMTKVDNSLQNCSLENGWDDAQLSDKSIALNADPSVGCKSDPAILEVTGNACSVECASDTHAGENSPAKCKSDSEKRIIIVGAGPAGLAAARHLQRQGFSVTILEARSRIGGRVYTDRSSLSVPVDLGASIITGVEADVATERRPDPSSLICSQLGLELTVLNSDCPLYDVSTGQKVPADLDETLEAEYNSLLDDMVLVVAQNGENAMKMSLEDGLEYALRSRRMARLGSDARETELQNSLHAYVNSRSCADNKDVVSSCFGEDILSPLERRVMNWHFAHLEYGCAALLKDVSLPCWNQDDVYGGFGGAHCMIKGGYSAVVESLGKGLDVHLGHVVTDITYSTKDSGPSENQSFKVKVSTSNGHDFLGDAVLITVPLGCLKAESIKFCPPLPQWKQSSIKRLGYGVLNKVVLEFPEVFWDDSVDYFGATAEETNSRGHCFMFWNVKKTVGAPVLIALVVGKAAIDGQDMSSHDHVDHAMKVLRKIFGTESVPDPVASVVTDWGRDPFSYGAYSYVAIGASGEDYDILGKPVENCLFFAGEATCKEHPDTVGGAMMSGLREAVRIIDIFTTGNDYRAEVEAIEAAQRQSDSERDEVRDIIKRLDAVELSNVMYKNSLEGDRILSREALLKDLFVNVKTTGGRLHLAKALLNLPVEKLKSFAGSKEGLSMLNSWILDSLGKDGTQLLRHCVRLLVLVSTDLLAVRVSGIGKTIKDKVCVHTSRDIRAIASQLVNVWLEVFRKEKALRSKFIRDSSSGKPPLRMQHGNIKVKSKSTKSETINDSKSESNSSRSRGSVVKQDDKMREDEELPMSEEERAAFAAAEAARAAARAAAEAIASTEARSVVQLPKIPSFQKFTRREQYAHDSDFQKKWSGGFLGRQDCISEIDSRNCRVREWSVDFPAACVNLDSSRMSVDNLSQRSQSNEVACHMNLRENSGESMAVDSSIFTKAWVETAGGVAAKDYHAIERWQSQAAAAESEYYSNMHIKDEEDSNTLSRPYTWKDDGLANEGSVSQVTVKKESKENHHRGADKIKQAVVDYVATLLMPLYKARKIDRDGYKSIMKKTATKVMEQASDAEKAMAVREFLDFKRRNKIRAFVDKLIERQMAAKPVGKA